MVIDPRIDKLVELCILQQGLIDTLMDKVNTLEDIARYQENQINDLQDEVLRLNGIVDTW